MQVPCNEYIRVCMRVCTHTLNFGIGSIIKKTHFILPVELQSIFFFTLAFAKFIYIYMKVTLQRNVLKQYGGNSVSLFRNLDGCGALSQGGKYAEYPQNSCLCPCEEEHTHSTCQQCQLLSDDRKGRVS